MQYILLLIGGFIVGNFSEFNFLIKAIQHLYKAKTTDDGLFPMPRQAKRKGKRLKELATTPYHKLRNIRVIKFSVSQTFKLYFMTSFPCLEKCVFPKSKLWRLISKGKQRLEEEFDIVNIVTGLRDLKNLTETLEDESTKVKLES